MKSIHLHKTKMMYIEHYLRHWFLTYGSAEHGLFGVFKWTLTNDTEFSKQPSVSMLFHSWKWMMKQSKAPQYAFQL